MKKTLMASLILLAIFGSLLTACVQLPTEKQGVTDMRPQLSFKVADEIMLPARVFVDGLDMGSVGDYAEGSAALRVLSGTHVIRVNLNGNVLADEKIYVGDGVNRTILVNTILVK